MRNLSKALMRIFHERSLWARCDVEAALLPTAKRSSIQSRRLIRESLEFARHGRDKLREGRVNMHGALNHRVSAFAYITSRME
jgi:hypothetical protein